MFLLFVLIFPLVMVLHSFPLFLLKGWLVVCTTVTLPASYLFPIRYLFYAFFSSFAVGNHVRKGGFSP